MPCVWLSASDGSACDADIQICSGPFDEAEECEEECDPPPPTIPCTMEPVSAVMNVVGGGGVCATSMDGLSATIGGAAGEFGLSFEDPESSTRSVSLSCSGDVWTASKTLTDSCQGGLSAVVTIIDATHLRITTTFGGALCTECDNQTISVEIIVTLA